MRHSKSTLWRCVHMYKGMAAGQAKFFKVACWFGEPPVAACPACTFHRIGIPLLALPGAGIVVAE